MKTHGEYSREALEKLLYRRQYILGPAGMHEDLSWNRLRVDDAITLAIHPDLEVYQATKNSKSITLLGYILDPNDAQATNTDIVNGLMGKLEKSDDICELTNELGGRWILLVHDGQETIALSDAAGLRQIYYTPSPLRGKVWCASQPGLIAGALKLEIDTEALEFMKVREAADNYNNGKVYWWPGDTSLYKEIKLLLPNHYLNLRSGLSKRFWPRKNLSKMSLREAVTKSSQLLSGLMKSAHNRYNLSLSMTAGWDSRLMLALNKDFIHNVHCFTLTYPDYTDKTKDVEIPSVLLSKIGIKHNLIQYPGQVNDEFKKVCRTNSPSPNKAYCADAQAMYDCLPRNRVCITGDVAEVVKCYYRLSNRKSKDVSAHDLAAFTDMGTHPFAIKAFEQWLSQAGFHNIHVLDLFSWEQVGGRWQALNQAEYDIVQESFAPYNCRGLLTTILSVDEKHRRPPAHTFQRKLIAKLWKDVLSEPVNPPEVANLKTALIDALIKLHIYQLIPEAVISFAKRLLK